MLEHQLDVGGKADAAAVAVNQLAIEAGFKRLNAAAQRRLTEVNGLGRASEVPMLGQGDEVMELAKIVHAWCASLFDLECIGIIGVAWPIFQYCQ